MIQSVMGHLVQLIYWKFQRKEFSFALVFPLNQCTYTSNRIIKKMKNDWELLSLCKLRGVYWMLITFSFTDEPQQKCNTSSSSPRLPPRGGLGSLYWSSKLTFSAVPPKFKLSSPDQVQYVLKHFVYHHICVLPTDLRWYI